MTDIGRIAINVSGAFFGLLCVFSIVTGIIYMSGKRQLNPLELSDAFIAKLDSEEKKESFARKMGLVTFVVGIVQGVTSWCLLAGKGDFAYWFALGFDLFSIASVVFKLKGKVSVFPLLKMIAYVLILVIMLQERIRGLYF